MTSFQSRVVTLLRPMWRTIDDFSFRQVRSHGIHLRRQICSRRVPLLLLHCFLLLLLLQRSQPKNHNGSPFPGSVGYSHFLGIVGVCLFLGILMSVFLGRRLVQWFFQGFGIPPPGGPGWWFSFYLLWGSLFCIHISVIGLPVFVDFLRVMRMVNSHTYVPKYKTVISETVLF